VRALTFDVFGGPEVLRLTERETPGILPSTAIVRMRAIGVNFADVYRRRGDYHLEGTPPYVLGYEGAGVIEALGGAAPGDPIFRVGDRVVFADVPHANAELVRAPLSRLIPLPQAISFDVGAALLLQGLTAHYLVNDSHVVRPGELAVVHAAAGGVGLLLTQMIKLRGGRVLALTSSASKGEVARAGGADHVATYDQDWIAAARASSEGRGADVVYDAVGSTLADSLSATRKGGHVVFYGMAGGNPALVDPRRLMDESKTLTGGDLWNVLVSWDERVRRANELFALVIGGGLQVSITKRFSLAEGAAAHAFLESRQSTGKVLLIPDLALT
jgi:NADPH:quinone reductase